MRIEPCCTEAAQDQAAVVQRAREVVTRHAPAAADGEEPDWGYPGLIAAAFAAQSAHRTEDASRRLPEDWTERFTDRLATAAGDARASARRSVGGACPAWGVDLAPPAPHLAESLDRARAQIPKRADRAGELEAMVVRPWREEDRATFCAAGCLLARTWPEMLDEVAVVVRQVALLEGFGIDGFTDFTCHGVIFVNSARLGPQPDGVPAEVRLAEAVVHEAAHTRCNAAAVSRPFLAATEESRLALVQTPLRSDPRPLSGLFQQLVVLVRSALLYEKCAGPGAGDGGRPGRAKVRGARRSGTSGARHDQRPLGQAVRSGSPGDSGGRAAAPAGRCRRRPAKRPQVAVTTAHAAGTGPFGEVQVFEPYPGCDNVVFARTAARSRAFAPTADGGPAVIVGAASGDSAADVVLRARGSWSSGPATSSLDGPRSASAGSSAATNSSGGTVLPPSTRTPGPRWRPTRACGSCPCCGPRGGPSCRGTRSWCRPALCTFAIVHRRAAPRC